SSSVSIVGAWGWTGEAAAEVATRQPRAAPRKPAWVVVIGVPMETELDASAQPYPDRRSAGPSCGPESVAAGARRRWHTARATRVGSPLVVQETRAVLVARIRPAPR